MKRLMQFLRVSVVVFSFIFTTIVGHGFVGSTLVETNHGFKKIEDIYKKTNPRDLKVPCCFDAQMVPTDQDIIKAAESACNHRVQIILENDGSYPIECAPYQAFYLLNQKKWSAACDIEVDDYLYCKGGSRKKVTAIKLLEGTTKMYIVQVESARTFFFGQYSVLAHNSALAQAAFSFATTTYYTGATIGTALLTAHAAQNLNNKIIMDGVITPAVRQGGKYLVEGGTYFLQGSVASTLGPVVLLGLTTGWYGYKAIKSLYEVHYAIDYVVATVKDIFFQKVLRQQEKEARNAAQYKALSHAYTQAQNHPLNRDYPSPCVESSNGRVRLTEADYDKYESNLRKVFKSLKPNIFEDQRNRIRVRNAAIQKYISDALAEDDARIAAEKIQKQQEELQQELRSDADNTDDVCQEKDVVPADEKELKDKKKGGGSGGPEDDPEPEDNDDSDLASAAGAAAVAGEELLEDGNSLKTAIRFFDKNIRHIFRKALGHFWYDTLQNRKILLDTAADMKNFRTTDENGNHCFEKILSTGQQIWVEVRDQCIRNGGINDVVRNVDPIKGFRNFKIK